MFVILSKLHPGFYAVPIFTLLTMFFIYKDKVRRGDSWEGFAIVTGFLSVIAGVVIAIVVGCELKSWAGFMLLVSAYTYNHITWLYAKCIKDRLYEIKYGANPQYGTFALVMLTLISLLIFGLLEYIGTFILQP